jgi:hypothetical protein
MIIGHGSPDPPPPSTLPSGPSGLNLVTVSASSGNGLQNVYLDDGSNIGNTGQEWYLTSEDHHIGVDPYAASGSHIYNFQYFEGYGSNNPVEITISSTTYS